MGTTMPDKVIPPYKAGNGGWLTASLFYEEMRHAQTEDRACEAVFSFTGREGFIDARKTFVELRDPTGYKWAMKYLQSYEHFTILMKAKWFREEYDSWIDELKAIMKSEAIARIAEIAKGSSVQSLPAAKYIAGAEWEKVHGRGRPSKAELNGELKKLTDAVASDNADAVRIGLRLVK